MRIEINRILIGFAIGSILTSFLWRLRWRRQIKQQQERDKVAFLLAKLKEMQDVLFQYRQGYTDSTLETMLSAYGSNQKGDLNHNKVLNERLRILVRFYAPELADSLTKLEESGKGYGNALEHCVNVDTQPEDAKKRMLYDLYNKQLNLNQAIGDMRAEVTALTGDRTYLESKKDFLNQSS
jgi:hypothetical protein